MAEFKFDKDDVDDNAVRIMQAVLPVLTDEHPSHVTAMLTLLLASYLTMMSSEAKVSSGEADAMADKIAVKVKLAMRFQRAHYTRFTQPGNA